MSTPSLGSSHLPDAGAGEHGSVEELAGQAQERARALADQARERARDEVERRSSVLGERASGTAEDLRDVAEHLRSQGKDAAARVAEQAAERVSVMGDYLRDTDGDRLLHDVESVGRRRPLAVIAGGAAIGLAASRFLKASSSERYRRVQPGRARTVLPSSAYRDTVSPTSEGRIG
jgi:hypothetical protein